MPLPQLPPELAAQLPRWASKRTMLRVVRALASQPYLARLCREAGVAVDTWAAITTNDVLDADASSGHGMRTSQVVAAARVQRSEKQVQRVRAINVRLGLMLEYYRGRELSGHERQALLERSPGHKQRGFPNAYAVGVFPPRQRGRISTPDPGQFSQVKANVHLPVRGTGSLVTHLLGLLPIAAADAAEGTEPPPAAQPRRRRRPGMTLAHEFLAHPGLRLFTGVAAGTLAGQLAPYQAGGWHGLALADKVLEEAQWVGIDPRHAARRPHAALKAILSHIDPVAAVVQGPADFDQAPVAPTGTAEPCGAPNCDHGWIHLGDNLVGKCPNCATGVRASAPADPGPGDPLF